MTKIALLCLAFCGCIAPTRIRIPSVHSVIMWDADAYVLMIEDGSGALLPRKIVAENVKIVSDVPAGSSMWVEYVDAPGELRGEGDRLILHVHAAEEVLH